MSVSSAVKWSQRMRATGSAAARPLGRQQPRSLAAEREWLLQRLATKPDVTLRALVGELGERGVVTSYGSVWRIVREFHPDESDSSLSPVDHMTAARDQRAAVAASAPAG